MCSPDQLEGFKGKLQLTVLKLRLIVCLLAIPIKFNETDNVCHSLFIKKFRSEVPNEKRPAGKTLHILNIPPYVNEEALHRVFSSIGTVHELELLENHTKKDKYVVPSKFFHSETSLKFKIAYVVFKKSNSVDSTMRLTKLPALNSESYPLLTGVAKWIQEHNNRIVDKEELQQEIKDYMVHYDKLKKSEEMNGKDEEADDDGWTTVGKTGHNAGFKQKESIINKLESKIQMKKKKDKQLTNFYTFERRENKKQELVDLRKRFSDDRRKMDTMRHTKRFNPF